MSDNYSRLKKWAKDAASGKTSKIPYIDITDLINEVENLRATIAATEAAKATEPKISVELPEGDDRKVTVFWHEVKDGVRHVCITVDDAKATGTVGELPPLPQPTVSTRHGTPCYTEEQLWYYGCDRAAAARAEAARQPAPVVAVKTWQERKNAEGDAIFCGKPTHEYMLDEIADLRAALAATNRSQP